MVSLSRYALLQTHTQAWSSPSRPKLNTTLERSAVPMAWTLGRCGRFRVLALSHPIKVSLRQRSANRNLHRPPLNPRPIKRTLKRSSSPSPFIYVFAHTDTHTHARTHTQNDEVAREQPVVLDLHNVAGNQEARVQLLPLAVAQRLLVIICVCVYVCGTYVRLAPVWSACVCAPHAAHMWRRKHGVRESDTRVARAFVCPHQSRALHLR